MAIFKAYDIRGVYPSELDASHAHRIGRATARFIGAKALVVGHDARTSSPELLYALLRGINDEGVDVIDIGLVATPMVYFAVDHLGAGGGIMITASHNPGQYNGFKICREHAIPIGEASGLREIEALATAAADDPTRLPRGSVESMDVCAGYVEHALSAGTERRRMRVAIDCGNGMAAVGLEPLLAQLDLEVERLYFEPDCTFPNHEADPLKVENLREVSEAAAFVALLDVLAVEAQPLSQLIAPLRRYSASGEINRRVDDISKLLSEIEAEHTGAEISHLDGLPVRYPDWWFNLRASNTEPVLRLNIEANTESEMCEKRDALLERIGGG